MKTPLTSRILTLSAALSVISLGAFAQHPDVKHKAAIHPVSLDLGKPTNTAPTPLRLPAAKPTTKSAAQVQTKSIPKTAVVQTVAAKPNPALVQTKPDIVTPTAATNTFNTLDSPTAAIGDSGRMMFFLIPMLLVTMGALKLLQRYQQKTGRLPAGLQKKALAQGQAKPAKSGGILSAILGSFSLNNAREKGGSNIRVVESVPIGGVNIHLVEVRGRLLLLGASGGNVNLLTEFQETEIDGGDFRALLNAAAAEMDGLSEYDSLPSSAVVGSIEDDLRETGEAMQKRLRRLRTVQEAEENPDWMRFDDAR